MDVKQQAVGTLVKQPVIVVDPDATLRHVAATLADDYIGAVVVHGSHPMGAPGSHAEGVVSERDIVAAIADGADPERERACNVMTLDLATAAPSDSIAEVAARMIDNEIRHVPLVQDGVVVGVVSERDVLRSLLAPAESELR